MLYLAKVTLTAIKMVKGYQQLPIMSQWGAKIWWK